MGKPEPGQTLNTYCACVNKDNHSSYSSNHTTWICKAVFKRRTGFWSGDKRIFEYYWECMNCGKKKPIGEWDDDGTFYGD